MKTQFLLSVLLAYLVILFIGTMYPFVYVAPKDSFYQYMVLSLQKEIEPFDIFNNLLLFIPFGFILSLLIKNKWLGLILVMLGGLALTISIEYLQMYMKTRVPSLLDIAANFASAVVGYLLTKIIK